MKTARLATDEVRALIVELDRALAANYSYEQCHGLDIDAIFQPHIRFFVARRGENAVGCGGIAFFDGFAEIKRMYVRPEARGSGVAQALVSHLENEAAHAGTSLVRLETGTLQAAAIRLYERCGFEPCAAFGDYAVMPVSAIETSLFYEKTIRCTANGGRVM